MSENQHDIEQVLLRYRPAGPRADLRSRVLAAARASAPARTSWPVAVYWGALAAMLLVAVGLGLAAAGMTQSIVGQVGSGPARWTRQAEEAAATLGGGTAARQYVALGLQAGFGRSRDGQLQPGEGRYLQ